MQQIHADMYVYAICMHTHTWKEENGYKIKQKNHKILSFLNKNILPNIKPYKKSLGSEKKIDVHAYNFNSLWRVMNRMNLIFSTMGSCEVLSG